MAQPPDLHDARRLLQTPLGQAGSARLRYGAAMTLYQAGQMDADVLEVYRCSASLDTQDPLALIADSGLPSPFGATAAIATLVAEIGAYLARLPGPGIADVRQRMAAQSTAIAPRPTAPNPITAQHLDAALQQAHATEPALACAIRQAAAHLNWVTYDRYDPQDIGADFAQGHAFTLIFGREAPIAADGFDLGLFLIAPHVLYRDHCHAAPELYAPLTGPHGWRFGPDTPLVIRPAHHPFWNPPFAPHLTKVGPVPFLCIFAWTADVDAAARVIPAKDWAALEALRLQGADAS